MSIKPNHPSMSLSEYGSLPGLSYEDLRDLKCGDLIVCVDSGPYLSLIRQGLVYKVQGHNLKGQAIILDCDGDEMDLDESDAQLFAKVCSSYTAPKYQVLQLQLEEMTIRAKTAEARVEAARAYIEGALNSPSQDQFCKGIDRACLDLIEMMRFQETTSSIKITLKD